MAPLGYGAEWRNFAAVIDKARVAASNQGYTAADLFVGVTEKGGGRPREDFELARFACYLVAMNGDPRKPEVAAAQAYFAIRTREAETSAPALTGPELLAAAVLESQRVIEQREARIHHLEQVVTEQAPKVTYVDTYVADADLLSFSTVASTNGITEKALRNLLIERDWIYSQTDSRWSESKQKKTIRNRYSEKASHKRHFRRVETHEAPRFRGSEVMHTLKITPQGAEAIARLIARAA
ncbi:phage antirepressor KilAC domain-containing protein [Gordonia sp. SCSIO 19800]|nr:phage antirepressor KilAC domain-containing protein [Gordonia sp. SCSIO 19800]